MPREASGCPNCQRPFHLSEENFGKPARCPDCQHHFIIGEPPQATSTAGTPETDSPLGYVVTEEAAPQFDAVVAASSSFFGSRRWLVAASVLLGLVAGYVIGRQHAASLTNSETARAGEQFADGLRLAFSAKQVASSVRPSPTLEQSLANPIDLGVFFTSPSLRLAVVDAHVGVVDVDAAGGRAISDRSCLLVSMLLQNANVRQTLRFPGDGIFQLRDDRGQPIPRVKFAFPSTKVVGAISAGVELAPRGTISHLQVFDVPQRETNFVILTVDLAGFGEPRFLRPEFARHEYISFKIPLAKVQGHNKQRRSVIHQL